MGSSASVCQVLDPVQQITGIDLEKTSGSVALLGAVAPANGEAPIAHAEAAVPVPGAADIVRSVEIIVAGDERRVDELGAIARRDRPPARTAPVLAVVIADGDAHAVIGFVADRKGGGRRRSAENAAQTSGGENQGGGKSAHPQEHVLEPRGSVNAV